MMNSLLACHTIPELSQPPAVWRVTSVPFTPVTPGWYVQRLANAPQRNEANVLSTFPECPLTGTHVSGSFGSKHLRLLMPKSLLWVSGSRDALPGCSSSVVRERPFSVDGGARAARLRDEQPRRSRGLPAPFSTGVTGYEAKPVHGQLENGRRPFGMRSILSRAPTPATRRKADPLADVQILGPHLSEEVSLTLIIHRGPGRRTEAADVWDVRFLGPWV
jgi:hypothetical protein